MSELKLKRKPDQDETNDLNKLRLECLELLQENNFPTDLKNPKQIATSLRQFIDVYKVEDVTEKTKNYDKIELAYGMGELYANAIIDTYNWQYFFIERMDGFDGFAVVSPDEKWLIFIHHYFHNLLHDKQKSNNSLLNYNMLDPKELQKYKSENYTPLS